MRRYLRFARMDSFGAFSNRTVGPFSPGLTVVHGLNEAGKSTLSAFIGGVLFGWESAHGSRNTYKPAHADRAGALVFACADDAGAGAAPSGVAREASESSQVFRARNADGLQGDVDLVADIDKETFGTLFSLSADELRDLRDADNVTARLLTAGSGTAASPAAALAALDRRIASYTSTAASASHSLKNLGNRLDFLRAQVRDAAAETERFKAERRELRSLDAEREAAALRIAHLNRRVDTLSGACARLDDLDCRLADAASRADEAAALLSAADAPAPSDSADVKGTTASMAEPLSTLSAAEERALRLQLEEFARDQDRARHRLDLARESQLTAAPSSSSKRRTGTGWRLVCILVFAGIVCALLGTAAFFGAFDPDKALLPLYGGLTSMVLFGLATVLLLVAAERAFRLRFLPSGSQTSARARGDTAPGDTPADDDAHERKVRDCAAELQALDETVAARLAAAGLSAAGSSARAALALLDDARTAQAARDEALRTRQRRVDEARALAVEAESLSRERALVLQLAGTPVDDAEGLAAALDRTAAERDALVVEVAALERRSGELSQRLSQAQLMHSFDDLKLEYQQTRTRFNDSQRDLVRLLLARRLLSRSIDAWEGHGQPQVYREAGRLLSLMTDGRWQRVERTADGGIEVVDAALVHRAPQQLSLGTRQQLYLVLRLALLLCAGEVGRCVPVLADDILVHFDDERRDGAACALAELARVRQVIVLTCHREVVESMRSADSSAALVEL